MKLAGKIALITGAGSNLGQTYAEALAKEGAAVAIGDLDGGLAQSVAQKISATGARAVGFEMDMAQDAHIEAGVQATIDAFGGVDILVNNAGLARGKWNDLSKLANDDWRLLMMVNVIAPLAAARACRPHMASRGGGVIVNQSSSGAYAALNSAYSVSKLTLSGLTVALATEFADDNIRVNGIAPGMMNGRMPPDRVELILQKQLVRRRGDPQDLVDTLLFLTTDASAFMSGQTLIMDGGMSRRV
jgi:3-oxoacyl-[acyl-carrier protein] reductase